MTLDKAIKYGKEKRQEYRKAKAFDQSCRNHGNCPWCKSNRQYSDKRQRQAADDHIKEFGNGSDDSTTYYKYTGVGPLGILWSEDNE